MLESAKAICEKNGVKINFLQSINPNRLQLFWYGGNVITLKYQNKELAISAVGDVAFAVFDEAVEKEIYFYRNKNNSGLNDSFIEELIPDDATMQNFIENLRIYWHYNNWIEYSVYENDKLILHETDTESTSLEEVLTDIKYFIQILKS